LIGIEPLTPEYFATVAGWLSKPEINQWLTAEWRDRAIDPTLIGVAVRNKRNRFFLVRSDGVPCGLVALADWDAVDKIAMIWYALGDPASGGRGAITQAIRELVRTAFDTLGIEALHAWIMEDNERSRRVLEKNGFRKTGRLRLAAVHNSRRLDRVYFDLTRQDRGAGLADATVGFVPAAS
jgi:RimJ/RimL family protein N-acetyltransferase